MNKKLNIMISINRMSTGGSATYVISLANELKQRGHRVTVVSTGGVLVEELTKSGIKHCTVKMLLYGSASSEPVTNGARYLASIISSWIIRPWRVLRFFISVIQFIKIIKCKNINVIHSNQPGPTLITYLASQITRVPFVTTVHGTLRTEFPPIGLRFIRKKFRKIIVISDEIKEHLIMNYQIDARKIAVIYNGIDLKKFYSDVNMTGLNTGNLTNLKRVAHIGGSGGGGLTSMLKAVPIIAQKVPDVEVVIPSADGEINILARKINQEFDREVVKIMRPTKDIIDIINSSEVVVAIGRSALEAMACGKPVVIAGRRTGPFGGSFGGIISKDNVPEIKKYNFSGRNSSEVTSPENIAEAIIKLLTDDNYRQEVGAFGRKIVEEEFNIEKIAGQMENVYLEVLEK
ncbi:MAG: hypothetical protein DRP97_00745 [Candidatus Latescibacterota bacterium]|nr:MAG: hypothetical protein DRP97_00745 [Candidatus Latescibacterota bacterium]